MAWYNWTNVFVSTKCLILRRTPIPLDIFFWNLLDLFFPIEMTVYENAKVLNTFLLINWLTIYFNVQGIVYLFLMRMKYYKMCFSNIERWFVGTKTQNYYLKSVCNFKVTRFYLILLCKQHNWTLCTNVQLRKLHIIPKGATLNSLKISEMSPHDSRMHACLLLATHLVKTGHKILGIIFLIFFACALSHYRVMTVICDIEISGKSQNYCLKSVCNFNVTRFYSILLCRNHNWTLSIYSIGVMKTGLANIL